MNMDCFEIHSVESSSEDLLEVSLGRLNLEIRPVIDHTYIHCKNRNDTLKCFGEIPPIPDAEILRTASKSGAYEVATSFRGAWDSAYLGEGLPNLGYGLGGVCHQATNRFARFLGIQLSPNELQSIPRGLTVSIATFGNYGRNARTWEELHYLPQLAKDEQNSLVPNHESVRIQRDFKEYLGELGCDFSQIKRHHTRYLWCVLYLQNSLLSLPCVYPADYLVYCIKLANLAKDFWSEIRFIFASTQDKIYQTEEEANLIDFNIVLREIKKSEGRIPW